MFDTREQFAEAFRRRTDLFVLQVIRFYQKLPKSNEAKILGKELLKSTTSVAANYRAACEADDRSEFSNKLSITLKEAEESLLCIELLSWLGIVTEAAVDGLKKENEEILSILNEVRFNKK